MMGAQSCDPNDAATGRGRPGLTPSQAKAVLEAALFAAGGPLAEEHLARILHVDTESVGPLLRSLADDLQERQSGLVLRRVAGGWQLVTRPELAAYLAELTGEREPAPLSAAALETLAVVAYRQPVTRAEIEAIRGVRVEGSLNTLVERGLVAEVGRKEVPGRPILYGTTPEFLQMFGLFSLADLPPIGDPPTLLDSQPGSALHSRPAQGENSNSSAGTG